jgi:hypothetical protein
MVVIDDEDSRIASGVWRPATRVAMCMTAATPSKTDRAESYDREGSRGEEQIRSGMLQRVHELPVRWYERGRAGSTA